MTFLLSSPPRSFQGIAIFVWKAIFLVFIYHLTMSVETFATEARNPFYLNYIGITDRTCLSCGHVIGAESEAPGANQDWLKYYRARTSIHSN
jgi:hypothetical protein